MYLEKLTISGFKSFAQKTELLFPKEEKTKNKSHAITSIVGPNGSGKSNIADAIRWVLGEQSLKLIRCKKSEDIIFSGSSLKSRINFAEVSIHFNNESQLAPVDYTQLTITRRLYRNGDSEYLINNNKVRLFDIMLLLAKSNIGTRSFSIIGQGMVDTIITASPIERGEFFNEAAGIKHFQIKRDQSLSKLLRCEKNLKEADTILHEITPHLKNLEKQVRKLRLKESLEKEKLSYSLEYYSRIWVDLEDKMDAERELLKVVDTEQEELEQKLRKTTEQLANLEQQKTRDQEFNDLQDAYLEISQQKNKLLRELTILQGKKDLNFQEQGKLDLVWLYQKEEEIENKIKSISKELRYFQEEKVRYEQFLKEKEIRLHSTEQEITKLEKELNELKNDLDTKKHHGPLSAVDQKVETLCAQQQKLLHKIKTATQLEDLLKLEKEAVKIDQLLKELKQSIKTLPTDLQSNQNQEHHHSEDLNFIQNEIIRWTKEKEELLKKINDDRVQVHIFAEKASISEEETEKQLTEKKKINLDISAYKETDPDKAAEHFDSEAQKTQSKIEKLNTSLEEISKKIQEFNNIEQEKKNHIFQLERSKQEIQSQWNHCNGKISNIKIAMARLETKQEDLVLEIQKENLPASEIRDKTPYEEFGDIENEALYQKMIKLKKQLEQIGGIDPEIITEYEQTQERYDFLHNQVTDMQNTIASLEKIIIELDDKIHKQFNTAFKKINAEFEKYFQVLFQGGKAKLTKITEEQKTPEKNQTQKEVILDSEGNPIEMPEEIIEEDSQKSIAEKYKKKNIRGIEISVSPPGKRLSNIEQLSGGERSLVAIALICAIIHNNPSPLVLLDEVDAALDEANSNRIAAVLQDLAQQTQFVIITHNRSIMYIADLIYGVTMGPDSVSKLLSVKIEDLDQHAARV
jgi:chromosome segregation protein